MVTKLSRWCFALAATLAVMTAASARADGLKYLPSDTEVVVSLNLQQVWGSKLVKDYSALIGQLQGMFNAGVDKNQIAAEVRKSLGIDPFKDVDAITVGLSDLTKNPKNVMIVLEGKFNQDKFTETANKAAKDSPEAVKSVTIGNATVYQITKPGDEPFYIGLLNKNTLVIAKTKDGMTGAVTPVAQNLKKETADLVQGVNFKKSLNLVMTAGAIQEAIKQGNNAQTQFIEPFLKDLNGAVITANVVSDVDLHVAYVAKDAAAAQKMAEETNKGVAGLKGLIGKNAPKDAKVAAMVDILNSLKITSQGNVMTVDGTVSRKVLDQTFKNIENFLP